MHLSSALHFPQFWHRTHWACEGALRLPRVDMDGASLVFAFSAHLWCFANQTRVGKNAEEKKRVR